MKTRKLIIVLIALLSFLSIFGACGIDFGDHHECTTDSDCGEEEGCDEGDCVRYISCD